jgi:hypothetical protein
LHKPKKGLISTVQRVEKVSKAWIIRAVFKPKEFFMKITIQLPVIRGMCHRTDLTIQDQPTLAKVKQLVFEKFQQTLMPHRFNYMRPQQNWF